jgi:hypothetical protein
MYDLKFKEKYYDIQNYFSQIWLPNTVHLGVK